MYLTPGIEISASVALDGTANITHTVCRDGDTEIQIGSHTGVLLLLSEEALREMHKATGEAITEIERRAAAA